MTTVNSEAAQPQVATKSVADIVAAWIERTTSTDHKSVARLYLGGAFTFLFVTLIAFGLMRAQLIIPSNSLISPDVFGQILSATGISFALLFAIPLALGIATLVVPLQIGARTVALPRINQFSAWLYLLGGATIWLSFLYTGPEAGILSLVPLSELTYTSSHGVDAWVVGVGLVGLGILLWSVNMLATLSVLRAPGMFWRRAPIFTWVTGAFSWLLLIGSPVLLAALTMLTIDRNFGGNFFIAGEGGSPLLYQHFIYFFFTTVYASVVLFGIGVIGEIFATFSGGRNQGRVFDRRTTTISLIVFSVLVPFAYLQNMYSSPVSVGWVSTAQVIALLLIVPLGLIVVNLIRTLWGGPVETRAPLLYAAAALSTMVVGLAIEWLLSILTVGWQYDNTADSQAATLLVFIGAAIFAGIAAIYYWLPKITGRFAGEGLGKTGLVIMLVGTYLYAIPMMFAGLAGQPVDIYRFYEGAGLDTYNLIASIGAYVFIAGAVLALATLAHGYSVGRRAGADPWGGTSLEWLALSPPAANNFDAVPDVRSDQPLRDIREAVTQRTGGSSRA